MKNILFTFVLVFPILILLFFVIAIKKIDTEVVFVTKSIVSQENNLKRELFIDKRTSTRRVYFYTSENNKIIQFKREYRGFFSDWFSASESRKYENDAQLSFYSLRNDNRSLQPFFSLNNKEKGIRYYFDIFQYVKTQYFFIFLISLLGYIFVSAGLIDSYGGITQHKIKGISIVFNIFMVLIILFF